MQLCGACTISAVEMPATVSTPHSEFQLNHAQYTIQLGGTHPLYTSARFKET